ncbi:hypothetical protein [Nostoc sp. ChiVER01]|nr:hypothetical protein [Nostoc sp. ChiVER01]MDZ8223344.1 hypothetical protein [Nostoc sp. ChiVER01]
MSPCILTFFYDFSVENNWEAVFLRSFAIKEFKIGMRSLFIPSGLSH